MRRRWTTPVLSVALLAALVWGYNQYQVRRGYELATENQYNRAFAELSTSVDGLNSQLSKAMVSNSPPVLMRFFSDIWRQAYTAQAALGQLPLGSVDLSRTKNFVAKAAAFTYGLAIKRDLRQKPLTEKEWTTLRDLQKTASYVSDRLATLQDRMIRGDDRWLDVDRHDTKAAVGGQDLQTNNVTKSFMMLEDGMKRLPDPDFEGNMLNFKQTPMGLTGSSITVQQGREIARRFVPNGQRMRVTYEGRNRGDFPLYVYSLSPAATRTKGQRAEDSAPIRVGVSVKGGHVVWMLRERPVTVARLNLNQAQKRAAAFLAAKGFDKTTTVARQSFENVATFSQAHVDSGYVVYPELFKVQVAQDNGEILAMEAAPYLTFHQPNKKIAQPKLNEAQARKKLNPHLKVASMRKAVILNDRYEKVPCWEATGTAGGQRFRVYLSALNGMEEKIMRIDGQGTEME